LRSVREGLVIFLSPMSAGAMVYLFSGIAVDFHVATGTTALLGAGGWTIANATGAFVGGRLAGRWGARRNYPLAGIAAGVCAVAIMLAPISPASFTLGSLAYAVAGGLCGAAAMALTIELTGDAGHAASTWFAVFYAASDLPWTYMQWADGQGYKHFGVRGMLGVDAIGNALPAILFLWYLSRTVSRRSLSSQPPLPTCAPDASAAVRSASAGAQ
jgi:MFS family permease